MIWIFYEICPLLLYESTFTKRTKEAKSAKFLSFLLFSPRINPAEEREEEEEERKRVEDSKINRCEFHCLQEKRRKNRGEKLTREAKCKRERDIWDACFIRVYNERKACEIHAYAWWDRRCGAEFNKLSISRTKVLLY